MKCPKTKTPAQAKWFDEQDRLGIPPIEQTYRVRYPDGRVTTINRFDFNLAATLLPTGYDKYIQCDDTGWIRVSKLTVV